MQHTHKKLRTVMQIVIYEVIFNFNEIIKYGVALLLGSSPVQITVPTPLPWIENISGLIRTVGATKVVCLVATSCLESRALTSVKTLDQSAGHQFWTRRR